MNNNLVNRKFKFYLLDTNNKPTVFIGIATGVHETVQGPKIYFHFVDGTYSWFIYKKAENLFLVDDETALTNRPPVAFGKAGLRFIPASGDANAPISHVDVVKCKYSIVIDKEVLVALGII